MLDAGIHNVTILGDRDIGLSYLPRATKVLRMLQDRMRLSGLMTGSQHFQLDGDDYCYARVAGDVNTITIIAGPVGGPVNKIEPIESARLKAPSLLSGVVSVGGYATNEDGTKVVRNYWPTPETQRIFKLPAGAQDSARLAVETDESISTAPRYGGIVARPQFDGIKPTMYTGRMKKVVQAILGLGFLPADGPYDYSVTLKEDDDDQIRELSPYDEEVKSTGYVMHYDFHWFRSHGIAKDTSGDPWLVEISATKGVVAMRLPLIPYSDTKQFLKKVQKNNDLALLACIEEFGGVPSGEGFPSGGNFDAMLRAGQILRLVEPEGLASFYELSAFSTACGWAFNDSGTEAHNTGYKDGPSNQYAEHHQVICKIGETKPEIGHAAMKELKERVKHLRDDYTFYSYNAALSKLLYMDEHELAKQYRVYDILGAKEFMRQLDALVVIPPVEFTGSASRAGRGNLSGVGTVAGWQMKFWHPFWPDDERAIISHDFNGPTNVSCDTTVFVFFAGDQLKYVKMFKSLKKKDGSEYDSNLNACMYEGSWKEEWKTDGGQVMVGYYTSDQDGRREFDDYNKTHEVECVFKGSAGINCVDYFGSWSDNGTGRGDNKWVSYRRDYTKTIGSQTMLSAVVCLPAYMRECFYYAERESQTGVIEEETHQYVSTVDPWAYHYRTFHSVPWPNTVIRRIALEPELRTNFPCWKEGDRGPLLEVEDQIYPDNQGWGYIGISPTYPAVALPALPANTYKQEDFKAKLKVEMVWFGGREEVINQSYSNGSDWYNDYWKWFEPSPDTVYLFLPLGALMSLWATANAFGPLPAVCYQKEPDGETIVAGASGDQYKARPCFIGVVNA